MDPIPDNTIQKAWTKYDDKLYGGITNTIPINGKSRNVISEGSAGVLIGSKLTLSDTRTNDVNVVCPGNKTEIVFENTRLPEDLATDCARGNAWTSLDDGGKCAIGNDINTKCVTSGVDYNTLCQMGDYITSDECQEQCKNAKVTDDDKDNYCHYALERLCQKKKGDPIKFDGAGNKSILSDKDWITEPICKDYCGDDCKDYKEEYCSITNNRGEYTKLGTKFCFDFCKSNPERCKLKDYCKDKTYQLNEIDNEIRIKDYCACMLPDKSYEDYKKATEFLVNSQGFVIDDITKIKNQPECIFPLCSGNAIRNKNATCDGTCLEDLMKNFGDNPVKVHAKYCKEIFKDIPKASKIGIGIGITAVLVFLFLIYWAFIAKKESISDTYCKSMLRGVDIKKVYDNCYLKKSR